MNRRLYRCRHDRRIAGVASGVAEFFDLDPTLVRVLWFISILFGGFGILLYVGLALIVPPEPMSEAEVAALATSGPGAEEPAGHRHAQHGGGRWTMFFGAALILIGVVALAEVLSPGTALARYLVPLFIAGIGVVLIGGSIRRDGGRDASSESAAS